MGNNMDLIELLGLPSKVNCPVCKEEVKTDFDDYDIECGDPILGGGKFKLDCYCEKCDNAYTYNFKVNITDISIVRE